MSLAFRHNLRHSAELSIRVVHKRRRDAGICKGFEILFAHNADPAMLDEICSELLIFDGQIFAFQIRNEEIRNKDADETDDGS